MIEDLKNTFEYNPETGVLLRIRDRNRSGYYSMRDVCGTINHGYIVSSFERKLIANHRIAWALMTGSLPPKGMDIDHINGKKDDNRWCNLRLARRGQNNMNSGNPKNNTTGQKGVHPTRGRWFARIKVNQEIIHLGVFKSFDEAVVARKKAEEKYFGEFRR